ncbi:MAG: hypothetical protein C4547_06795 [Phycisphaerales bacterium]|nr:MAG: hypothetical protein C4547_06795 [Phycisphaerales bacterium]
MTIRVLVGWLAAVTFVAVLAAQPARAECSGQERLRVRCKVLNEGNNKLKVTVVHSEPNSSVEVLLDGEPIGDIETNSKGRGKLVRTGVADGPHTVEVCGVQKPTKCGQ